MMFRVELKKAVVRNFEMRQELNKFLRKFVITVHKKDNKDHKPNSLRAFFASFDHHLKKKTMNFAL